MREVSINDDYAIMRTPNYGFYYGYEYDTKECECGESEDIFGFEVNNEKGICFEISYEDMTKIEGCPQQWECEKCLLFGIGLFLDKVNK